jgi:hypothetical protein
MPGQILVPFGILDFVDLGGPDRSQIAMHQPPLDHILYRLADSAPGAAECHGRFLSGQLVRPVNQEQHMGLGPLVLANLAQGSSSTRSPQALQSTRRMR